MNCTRFIVSLKDVPHIFFHLFFVHLSYLFIHLFIACGFCRHFHCRKSLPIGWFHFLSHFFRFVNCTEFIDSLKDIPHIVLLHLFIIYLSFIYLFIIHLFVIYSLCIINHVSTYCKSIIYYKINNDVKPSKQLNLSHAVMSRIHRYPWEQWAIVTLQSLAVGLSVNDGTIDHQLLILK